MAAKKKVKTKKRASQQRKSEIAVPEPPRDRPTFAQGYGIKPDGKGLIAWNDVRAKLAKSKNYWVATARPDGRPHSMPIWGVWLDGALIFGTDRNSRKARNLQRQPIAIVHLESGDDAVILECDAREVTDPAVIATVDCAVSEEIQNEAHRCARRALHSGHEAARRVRVAGARFSGFGYALEVLK